MKIALIEPFFGGSHKSWALGLAKHTELDIELYPLKDQRWKVRMGVGCIELAHMLNQSQKQYQMLLTTSLLDAATFKSLLNKSYRDLPMIHYMHENQLTYPDNPADPDKRLKRDFHYGLINIKSILASDKTFFNSHFHRDSFIRATYDFLKKLKALDAKETCSTLEKKSDVLELGLDLTRFDAFKSEKQKVVTWNHRFEYDKNPAALLEIFSELDSSIKLNIIGEDHASLSVLKTRLENELKENINLFDYQESFEDYAKALANSSFGLSTSFHDFFGIGMIESAYMGNTMILPNRVAYPEVFGEQCYFYEDNNEAREIIHKLASGELSPIDGSNHVRRFDWSNMKHNYLEAFHKLV